MSSRPTSRPVFHTWMRRKSVRALRRSHAEHSKQHGGLKRVLGLWSLVAIGIGCTIGAGIFVMPGIVAATHAGPGILLSFMLAGVACAIAALCYAELAVIIPASGSAYSYTYATLGELAAWLIGWNLLLEYGLANSAVAADRAQHWSRAEACGALPGAHCSNRAGALLIVDADGARLASLVCFGERQRD